MDVRVCVAAAERSSGLRDTVPVGAALPMTAGSAAQVLLAWEEGERMHRGLRGAKFTATTLAGVRRRGWAASAAEREAGVASVSAPVRGASTGSASTGSAAGHGRVLAAVSVSGPIERLTRSPGRLHAAAVVAAGSPDQTTARPPPDHRQTTADHGLDHRQRSTNFSYRVKVFRSWASGSTASERRGLASSR
jgi:DNA-binding IclR family transcriptional regulator